MDDARKNKGIDRFQIVSTIGNRSGGLTRRLVLLLPAAAHAQGRAKMGKDAAAYQTSPRGGLSCAGCTFFRKPDVCEVVEGPVSSSGWCRLFDLPD